MSSTLVLPSCHFIPFPLHIPGRFLGRHSVPASLCFPDHHSHGLTFPGAQLHLQQEAHSVSSLNRFFLGPNSLHLAATSSNHAPPPQRLEESQQTQKHGPKELCCSCPSGVIRRNVSQSPVCSADFPFPPFTVQSCLPEGVLSSLSTETRCDHFSVLPQLVQRGAQMLGKCSLTDESLFIGHKTWQSVCLQDLVAFLLEGRSWSRSPFCPRPPG